MKMEFGSRIFFHGGSNPLSKILPEKIGVDGEMLCASASPNVARRYGEHVAKIEVSEWWNMTLDEFFANKLKFKELRQCGVKAVIVAGNREAFDFPVDTLFLLSASAAKIISNHHRVLSFADDDLPSEYPLGPASAGWEWYVTDLYNGNVSSALIDSGWEVIENGQWTLSVCHDGIERGARIEDRNSDRFQVVMTEGTHIIGTYVATSFPDALGCADRFARLGINPNIASTKPRMRRS